MGKRTGASVSKNIAYNLLYQLSLYITPLITTPYLSRVLGGEMIGRYSFAQSIVSYFVLVATMGTSYYGQRRIAAATGDNETQTRDFWEIVCLRGATTIVAIALYCGFVVPRSIDPILYVVAGLEILQVSMDISWYFQGKESFQVIALCSGTARIMAVVLILLFVKKPEDLSVYVFLYCGTLLLGFLSQWLYLPRYLNKGVHLHREKRIMSFHLISSVKLFVAQAAIQVYTVLDKTMIGMITNSELQNGYYEQAQKLVRILVAVSTSISAVMASRIAVLSSKKDSKAIEETVEFSFRFVSCISIPIIFGIVLVAQDFVPFFYGQGYDGVIELLVILSALPLVIGCSNIIGIQYLVPTGQEKFLTISVLTGSAVNVILNFFLIRAYAAAGAATASVIAEICVTLVQFIAVRKQISAGRVLKIILRYVLLSIPMFVVGVVIRGVVQAGVLRLALVICGCVIMYGVELVLTRDPFMKAFGKE